MSSVKALLEKSPVTETEVPMCSPDKVRLTDVALGEVVSEYCPTCPTLFAL